nr:hypothetical protein KPHV_10390 [Kitasatospora purpeofusca]
MTSRIFDAIADIPPNRSIVGHAAGPGRCARPGPTPTFRTGGTRATGRTGHPRRRVRPRAPPGDGTRPCYGDLEALLHAEKSYGLCQVQG